MMNSRYIMAVEPIAVSAETFALMIESSKAEINRGVKDGTIPPPMKFRGRKRRWSVKMIRQWVDSGMPNAAGWAELMERARETKERRKTSDPSCAELRLAAPQ